MHQDTATTRLDLSGDGALTFVRNGAKHCLPPRQRALRHYKCSLKKKKLPMDASPAVQKVAIRENLSDQVAAGRIVTGCDRLFSALEAAVAAPTSIVPEADRPDILHIAAVLPLRLIATNPVFATPSGTGGLGVRRRQAMTAQGCRRGKRRLDEL